MPLICIHKTFKEGQLKQQKQLKQLEKFYIMQSKNLAQKNVNKELN